MTPVPPVRQGVQGERLAARPVFRRILYAQGWEDPDVLCEALRPGPDDHVLSIAAAGDNSLALLLAGAGRVTAVDLSLPQIALVELKVQGIRRLDYAEFLGLLGLSAHPDRAALYRAVRPGLSADARGFWDAAGAVIAAGVAGSGKFERYLALFRRRILPLVHSADRVGRLLDHEDVAQQAAWYARHWDTWRWRLLFRLFFGRRVMARAGRDAAFFAHVDGRSVSARLLERTRRCLETQPAAGNWFLEWILTGRYRDPARAHPYLRPEGFRRLKDEGVAERLALVRGELDAHLASVGEGTYSAFNLSDVFEYMDADTAGRVYDRILAAARPGARVAYWNLLVNREAPGRLDGRVERLGAVARDLHARDRAWFYERFVLERRLG